MSPSNASESRNAPVGGPGVFGDPWGLKRAENLITSLTGVLGARIVATPMGEITEIHVLTTTEVAPKQVVRNIESALMAQLGLRVDHRKISVAQTAEVRRLEQGAVGGVVQEGSGRRVALFQSVEMRPAGKLQRVEVVVRMESEGREVEGVAEGADTLRNRVEAAARAATAALEEVVQDPAIVLEGAKLVEAFDRTFVFVAIQGLGGRESNLLTGTCEVRDSAERAAVLAVLDATNRWAEARRV